MAVEKMYLVNMISDLENLDRFLEDVINIGEIEPVDAFNQVTNRNFNITASTENVDITEDINKLTGFDRTDNNYIEKLSELKDSLELSDSDRGNLVDPERVEEFYGKLHNLLEEKNDLEENLKKLKEYQKNINILKDHKIDIEKLENLKYFDYRFGSVSEDGRFILKNNYENIPSLIIHLDKNVDNASINAINEIYSLDEATYNLRQNTNKVLEEEKINARNVSLSLDKDYNIKTSTKSNEIYKQIMDGADKKIDEINKDYQSKINKMDNVYSHYKDEIVDQVVDFLLDV